MRCNKEWLELIPKASRIEHRGAFCFVRPRIMVTKKRILLIASLPLAIAVTLGILAMLPPRPGVTKANFDRIQEGMKRVEVEAILGQVKEQDLGIDFWFGDDQSLVMIGFSDDCVFYKQWHDSHEPLLDKIRRLLHLR
jgi:hypothetical protein